MARKIKTVEIEGKKYKIEELDCLKARRVFLLMSDPENRVQNTEEATKILFSNVQIDGGDGNLVTLDTEELIKQNLSFSGLGKLEREATDLTFGFLAGGEESTAAKA